MHEDDASGAVGEQAFEGAGFGEGVGPTGGDAGGRDGGIVAEHDESLVFFKVGDMAGDGLELRVAEGAAGHHDLGTGGIEAQQTPVGGQFAKVRERMGNEALQEVFHAAMAGGAEGVAIMVAGDDDEGELVGEGTEETFNVEEFIFEGGGSDVAGEQDHVGLDLADALDEGGEQGVVETEAAVEEEVGVAEQALAKQPPGFDVEREEMNIANEG